MNKRLEKKGFNQFFERKFRKEEKKIPYLSSFDVDSYIEEVSANRISGGLIKSKDGKLVVNLDTGHITYNDGLTETNVV